MEKPIGIRGSALTGIADTALIILDGGVGTVPGGYVVSGRARAYHLAVCRECGDMVMPFDSADERDGWAVQHPHDVSIGVELRDPHN